MRTIASPAALGLALLFTAGNAHPQQAASQRYTSVISLQVPADKESAFVEFYKTGAGSKTVRARMKANSNALGWSLRRVVYPGDPAPRANFLIAAVGNGAPQEPDLAKRDEMYRAASGMTYAEYMQQVRSMSTQVGSTLWHVHHITPTYSLAEGDYVVANRLKTAEGKNAELNELMRDVRMVMATERIKAGTQKGWAFSHISFPSGSALPYDATVSTVYKDLAGTLGGGGGGGGAVALFTKLFPNKNYTRYIDDSREAAKTVRTELYRVAVAIQP